MMHFPEFFEFEAHKRINFLANKMDMWIQATEALGKNRLAYSSKRDILDSFLCLWKASAVLTKYYKIKKLS